MMLFWAIVGYLFLFIFRPHEYWPILGTLRIERIYMIMLMGMVFLNKEKRYIPHSINLIILLFFCVMVCAGITSLNGDAAFVTIFEYFKLLVFYYIIISCIRDEEQLKNFIVAYIAIMLLYVGKSCWEYFLHDRNSYQQGIARLVGIDTSYGDSNSFAASIVYSFPFLWALLRYRIESRWQRVMLWVYVGLSPVAIVYTGSRSGMVACLFFLFLLWIASSRKVTSLIVLSITLAGSWSFMPEKLQGRFLSIFDKDVGPAAASASASAQGRIDGFLQGIEIFKNNPLFGVGPGNFKFSWDAGMQAHNLYGQVLGDLGGFGTIVFFIMVVLIYLVHKNIISRIRQINAVFHEMYSKSERSFLLFEYLSVASTQAILILLFNGLFGHNLYRYNWLWIAAIGILSSNFISKKLNDHNDVSSPETHVS